jgi:alkylhydroperoxidase family enzyme
MQERKVGEIFSEDNEFYIVLASGEIGCDKCGFNDVCQRGNHRMKKARPLHLVCMAKYRTDNTSVYFRRKAAE